MPSFGYLASARGCDCRPTLFINERGTLPPMPRVNDISNVDVKQNVKATLIISVSFFKQIAFLTYINIAKTFSLQENLRFIKRSNFLDFAPH